VEISEWLLYFLRRATPSSAKYERGNRMKDGSGCLLCSVIAVMLPPWSHLMSIVYASLSFKVCILLPLEWFGRIASIGCMLPGPVVG
jgi:hypothetical protein